MTKEKAKEDQEQKQEAPNTDSWNDFAGDYIKPELVKEWPLVVACKDIESSFNEGRAQLAVKFEYSGRDWLMNINKTNQDLIRKEHKLGSPKELIGKKLTFNKTKARNPATNALVDSFVLEKIE